MIRYQPSTSTKIKILNGKEMVVEQHLHPECRENIRDDHVDNEKWDEDEANLEASFSSLITNAGTMTVQLSSLRLLDL